MPKLRHLPFCAVLTVAAMLFAGSAPTQAAKTERETTSQQVAEPAPPGAKGSFRDRNGAQHSWQVNPAFAMTWEGRPYLPVGMTFSPRSLAELDKPEAWAADVAALAEIKRAGVQDLSIQPARAAATVPPAIWQRLVDHLDAEGFRYGIALPAAAIAPAAGYYVRAGNFRIGPVSGSGDYSLDIRVPGLSGAGVQRVAAVVLAVNGGSLQCVEWAKVEPTSGGARATVHVELPAGQQFTIDMVPLVSGVTGLPDLWNAFADARDSLLPLADLKFGPGLRFLSHPFSGAIDLDQGGGYVVPVSDTYRMEFEAFLGRKYRGMDTLRNRWAFQGAAPTSMEAAARLVPLGITTVRKEQVGYLLDEKDLRCYAINVSDSSFWYDHLYFREDSLRTYLNQMDSFLREQVANVPVVVQRSGDMRWTHINDQANGGFSGVGIRANSLRLLREAGFALAEARTATARPWCLALSLDGYRDRNGLYGALDTLRQMGLKGWFVSAADVAPATVASWLAAYQAQVAAQANAADHLPQYLLYPHSIRETGGFGSQHPPLGIETRQLAANTWWIPSLTVWQPLDLGERARGYGIGASGIQVILWSPEGKSSLNLRVGALANYEVRDAAGKKLRVKEKKGNVSLDLSPDPIILTGIHASMVVPVEAAIADMAELNRLVKEVGMKRSVREFESIASLAKGLNPETHPREVRNLLRQPLIELRRLNTLPAEPGAGAVPAPK